MAFCRHDLCSWIPTGLSLIRVGSCFLSGSFGEEGRCQAASKAKTSKKGCRKLRAKKNKFVFGEEHAASHIQVGTAVTELAKYVLQVDIWQSFHCYTALYGGLRESMNSAALQVPLV